MNDMLVFPKVVDTAACDPPSHGQTVPKTLRSPLLEPFFTDVGPGDPGVNISGPCERKPCGRKLAGVMPISNQYRLPSGNFCKCPQKFTTFSVVRAL